MATEDFSATHDSGGTFTVGNKEDWSETIWNISPDDTPLLSAVKRDTTPSVVWQWYTEVLKNASAKNSDANAQGSSPSASEDVRYECENYTMILDDAAYVTRTQEHQKKVGVDSELNHQMMNKMIAMKKSMELALATRVTKRKPLTTATAGLAAGIPGQVGLYADQAAHVSGTRTYGDANTVNVQVGEEDFENDTANSKYGFREFKETLKNVWMRGSRPSMCFCSPTDKEYVDAWDTSGVTRESGKINEVNEMVDVVITSFGKVLFVPMEDLVKYNDTGQHTYDGTAGTMITDFALLIDPKYIVVRIFDDFFTETMAKTNDGWTKRGLVEFTFECSAPEGIGVFDFAGNSGHSTTLGLFASAASYTL